MSRYVDKPNTYGDTPRTIEAIERDIKYWEEQSAACPWCSWGCWCDGSYSPESRLEGYYKELTGAKAAKGD